MYLALYRDERKRLLAKRGELALDHLESVATTFSLAFKKVAEASQAAADLLCLCAFLDADAIPEEIFIEGAIVLGESFSSESLAELEAAMREAGRYSLLKRNPESRTSSHHRLVEVVLKDEMDGAFYK